MRLTGSHWCENCCFNSLQTGKGIQSVDTAVTDLFYLAEFPFPSNGKGESKQTKVNGEEGPKNKFPFPSNGKGESKEGYTELVFKDGSMFPFPSNGKGESK